MGQSPVVPLDPITEAFSKIGDQECGRLKVKFYTAYFVAVEKMAMLVTSFTWGRSVN